MSHIFRRHQARLRRSAAYVCNHDACRSDACDHVEPRHLTGEALVDYVHAGMDVVAYRDLAAALFAARFERDDVYAYRAPRDQHYTPVRRDDRGVFRRSRTLDDGSLSWYGPPLPDIPEAIYRALTDDAFGLVGSYALVPTPDDGPDVVRCAVTDLDEKERHDAGKGLDELTRLRRALYDEGLAYDWYSIARSKGGRGYHVTTLHPPRTNAAACLNLHRLLHRAAGLPADTETYPRAPRAGTRDRRASTGSGQYALPGSLHHLRRSGGSVLLDPRTLDPLPMREWAARERAQHRIGIAAFRYASQQRGQDLLDPRLFEAPRPTIERCLRREALYGQAACTPERLHEFADYHGLEPGELRETEGHQRFTHFIPLGRCPREHHHSDDTPGNARLYIDERTGALGWNCHHAGCSGVPWREMRRELDPGNAFRLGVRRQEGPRVDPRTVDCSCSRCQAEDAERGKDRVERPSSKTTALHREQDRALPDAFASSDALLAAGIGLPPGARHGFHNGRDATPGWLKRLRRMSACRKVYGFDVCRHTGCGGPEGKVKAVRIWVCESSYCARCGPIRARIHREHVLETWCPEGHAVLTVDLPDDPGDPDLDPLGTARDVRVDHVGPALNNVGLGGVEDGSVRWLLSPRGVAIFARREALVALRSARRELEQRLPGAVIRAQRLGRGAVARVVHDRWHAYSVHVVEVLRRAARDPSILTRAACLDPSARRVRTRANEPGDALMPWKTLDAIRTDAAAKVRERLGCEPGTCPDCGRGTHHRLEGADGTFVEEFEPGTPVWRIRDAALTAGAMLARINPPPEPVTG